MPKTPDYPAIGAVVRWKAYPRDAPWTITSIAWEGHRFPTIELTSTLTKGVITLCHVSRKSFWHNWRES